MTELGRAVDSAVLDELRESVGDDPVFLAELVDELLQDAPAQLESLRGAATSGDATGARRAAVAWTKAADSAGSVRSSLP